MSSNWAILDENKNVVVKPVLEAAKWLQENMEQKRVAKDTVGDTDISTVFLGLDHAFGSRPLWFETMTFGGKYDQFQDRYETYLEALAGHKRVVERIKAGLDPEEETK